MSQSSELAKGFQASPARHRRASDMMQELLNQADIEDTGILQVQELQREITEYLEKINVLNNLHFGIDPYTITQADIKKLIVIAESVRGISHFGERVAMGEAGVFESPIDAKPAEELGAGDLVVYRSAVLGPQNLRIAKLYGTTQTGKLLFETEAVSMDHDQLPADMRFLELSPTFLIEIVSAPVEVHDPAPDALEIGARFKNQPTERDKDPDFWDSIVNIVKQSQPGRAGRALNPHLMDVEDRDESPADPAGAHPTESPV